MNADKFKRELLDASSIELAVDWDLDKNELNRLMFSFIDVEASGLGSGSYPIEVGVALEDGTTHCMLICPPSSWTHWDESAEQLHGISRESLLLSGRSPIDVAMMLNELLGERVIYSDAWGNDACWLARLFDEAGVTQRFRIDSIVSLMNCDQLGLWSYAKEQAERQLFLRRHRASNDARVLHKTFSMLSDEELTAHLVAKCRAESRAQNVVDIDRARLTKQDVDATQLSGEKGLDRQLVNANDEQLLSLLDKKQLQY